MNETLISSGTKTIMCVHCIPGIYYTYQCVPIVVCIYVEDIIFASE